MIDVTAFLAALSHVSQCLHTGDRLHAERSADSRLVLCCSSTPGPSMELAEVWILGPCWACQPQGGDSLPLSCR